MILDQTFRAFSSLVRDLLITFMLHQCRSEFIAVASGSR